MIGKLKGIVDHKDKDHIIIDVNGVGYIVFCSSSTIQSIGDVDQLATLIIETHVREDHIHLYGFITYSERDWFRALVTAKGVGNKVALSILSHLPPAKLAQALRNKDKTAFTQISGIGPKLAERIIIELKDKIVNSIDMVEILEERSTKSEQDVVKDAISALVNLGYNKNDVSNIVNRLYTEDENLTVGQLIKFSLKGLAK